MSSTKLKAANHNQYDSGDVDWLQQGKDQNSPTRANFWYYIQPFASHWKGKKIADIGSGTSWLLALAQKNGAAFVQGIEPSKKNVQISRQLYPDIPVGAVSFENFTASESFDVLLSIMSLPHIDDLEGFFLHAGQLLQKEGELFIIVPDYDYYSLPRFDYEIEIERVNGSEYIASITRPSGTLTDIVRRKERYIEAAQSAGFRLEESQDLVPSTIFLEQEPRYQQFKDTSMFYFLRFRKIQ